MSRPQDESVNVEALAEEYLARLRRGEHPDVTEYAERYPALADDIRRFFPALHLLERFKPDSDDESSAGEKSLGVTAVAKPPLATLLPRLGDYRIVREVGRGGMGVVYEAVQESLGRQVALKVLPSNALSDPRRQKRFIREARAAGRLHHTNIVPVYGVGESDGQHYYAMQFINGQGLDKVIQELRNLRGRVKEPVEKPSGAVRVTAGAEGGGVAREAAVPTVTAAQVAGSLWNGHFSIGPVPRKVDAGSSSGPPGPTDSWDGNAQADTAEAAPSPCPERDTDEIGKLDTQSYALPGPDGGTSQPGRSISAYWLSVARIGVQVAEALQHAHENGILHRDIKPSNLLLDARGTVWVTDFGLAKADDQEDLTHTGDVIGTVRYMAPELFGGSPDARSDVYSLGLTLYELLALRPAFDAPNRQSLVHQVMHDSPPRLRTLDRQIPRDLETIVHKAIDRERGARYQTAGELADDLRRFLGDEPIKARRVSYAARFARWCRKNKAVATLVGAISILLIAVAVGSTVAAAMFRTLAGRNQQLANDNQAALREAKQSLFDSSLAEARANRWSRRPGQRLNAMAAIERASRLIEPLGLGEEARTALRDEAIAAMSLPDLKRVETWDGPPQMSWPVSFSPDLSHYAVYDRTNKVVRVHSTARPESDVAVLPYTKPIPVLLISPDNRYLVYVSFSPAHATVWDLATQKVTWTVTLPGASAFADISPDGRLLAFGQHDEVVSIYELDTGKLIRQLRPTKAEAYIRRVKFSPDGRLLAVGWPESGAIEVLDVTNGDVKLKLRLANSPEVWSIAWDPQGRWLAVGSWKEINIWDLRQPNRPPILAPGHESAVDVLQFHPSGELLASFSWDGTTRIWEAATGFQLLQLEDFFHGFSPDGRRMAAQRGLELGLWEVILPVGSRWIYANEPSLVVALDRDDRLLALGNNDGIRLYDLKRHQQLASRPLGRTLGLQFHPEDGGLVTSTANARGVQHWPVRSKTAGPDRPLLEVGPPKPLHPAFRASGTLSMSRDGRTVIAHEANRNAAVLVNLTAGEQRMFRLQRPFMDGVAVSPDGNWAAAGNRGGQDVYVWNARTGEQVRVLTANANAWAFFSPDNRWLAANSGEAVRFWEVGTWQLRYTYPATSNVMSPVAFTLDCRVAAIGRRGMGLHLIDLSNAKPLAMLASNQRRPHFDSMCFSSDGGTLVVAQGDAGVCVWDLRTIRGRLREMGLDWDQPPIPAPRDESPAPLEVVVDPGPQSK